ncbi:M48 family metallopeptidase [Kiloniella laminariae]|uniref:Protease HtpX homolog n=1 Tax=Kiloniella laminariae TaxID=454162 RepID=A0ABT4LE77_9PROT|nr:M48 family metallopeptidase [Kiloniella laminariae]MCZ4279397.1 M48 family metallopeptidase [Kiloniella laminariae]
MSTASLVVQSTDFKSAQARNRRNSLVLCLIMITTAVGLGYVSGWAAEILTGAHPALDLIRPRSETLEILRHTLKSEWGLFAAIGMFIFSLLSLCWTWLFADRTLLSLNSAIKADAEDYSRLHNVVEEMAIASGLPKPEVYIIQDEGMNAFATGLRPDLAAVTVTSGLYNELTREELQGVVAHEIAHILNRDVQYAVLVAVGAGLIAVFAEIMLRLSRLFFSPRSSRSKDSDSKGAGLIMIIVGAVWLLAAILAPIVALLVRMAISREREYLADATAAQLTRNPKGLASALLKINDHAHLAQKNSATEHLFIINPNRAFSETAGDLTSTHPATSLRIKRLMNLA